MGGVAFLAFRSFHFLMPSRRLQEAAKRAPRGPKRPAWANFNFPRTHLHVTWQPLRAPGGPGPQALAWVQQLGSDAPGPQTRGLGSTSGFQGAWVQGPRLGRAKTESPGPGTWALAPRPGGLGFSSEGQKVEQRARGLGL